LFGDSQAVAKKEEMNSTLSKPKFNEIDLFDAYINLNPKKDDIEEDEVENKRVEFSIVEFDWIF
jgi:hypothetical protein